MKVIKRKYNGFTHQLDEIVIFESNNGGECMAAYMRERLTIPDYGKDVDVMIVYDPGVKDYNLRPELGKVYKDKHGNDLLCLMVTSKNPIFDFFANVK